MLENQKVLDLTSRRIDFCCWIPDHPSSLIRKKRKMKYTTGDGLFHNLVALRCLTSGLKLLGRDMVIF